MGGLVPVQGDLDLIDAGGFHISKKGRLVCQSPFDL
jgi:hypothetical protein